MEISKKMSHSSSKKSQSYKLREEIDVLRDEIQYLQNAQRSALEFSMALRSMLDDGEITQEEYQEQLRQYDNYDIRNERGKVPKTQPCEPKFESRERYIKRLERTIENLKEENDMFKEKNKNLSDDLATVTGRYEQLTYQYEFVHKLQKDSKLIWHKAIEALREQLADIQTKINTENKTTTSKRNIAKQVSKLDSDARSIRDELELVKEMHHNSLRSLVHKQQNEEAAVRHALQSIDNGITSIHLAAKANF